MVYKVAIIGGGCAGLTAAIYCARALFEPVVFADTYENKGGLLAKTSTVENYPGFPSGVNGFDLIDRAESQAKEYGATIIDRKIVDVDFEQNPFKLVDSNGVCYYALSVIIATGSSPNRLDIAKEDNFWSRGISSCAVCDGALYRDRKIMVVGGGDTAMEEALFLTKFSNVKLVHRRDQLRASKVMQSRVIGNPKIEIIYDTVITKLDGDVNLKVVTLTNVTTGEITQVEVDGLFYGLGLKPNTELFAGKLAISKSGYIVKYPDSESETSTSIKGVFVAGDANDGLYRQAVVACGDGCKAAMDVEKYLVKKIGN